MRDGALQSIYVALLLNPMNLQRITSALALNNVFTLEDLSKQTERDLRLKSEASEDEWQQIKSKLEEADVHFKTG